MKCAAALFSLISATLRSLFASFGAADSANDGTNQDNFDNGISGELLYGSFDDLIDKCGLSRRTLASYGRIASHDPGHSRAHVVTCQISTIVETCVILRGVNILGRR